jgi:hypothetical protein
MDMTTAIILIFIGAAIGFLIGILLLSLRGKSANDKPEKESAPKEWKDLVHLGRRLSDRRFAVGLDGITYQVAKELSDDQLIRLIELSNEFQRWLQSTPTPAVKQGDQTMIKPSVSTPGLEKKLVSPLAEKEKSTKVATVESIVAQIDAILQVKLQDTPYASQGVRLMELPGQGMVVIIGLNKYQEINEIPDGQIRRLIQEAVADWEKQPAK